MADDAGQADPVSWLMIRSGWKVVASDGTEVGHVDEVAGDENEDIFDGLAVATTALGKPTYVPAEQVGVITDGVVHVKLDSAQVGQLGEYLEPATSARIEADDRSGVGEKVRAEAREVEGKIVGGTQKHEHSMSIWRRIGFFFRRGMR